jgi:hypothetical protein
VLAEIPGLDCDCSAALKGSKNNVAARGCAGSNAASGCAEILLSPQAIEGVHFRSELRAKTIHSSFYVVTDAYERRLPVSPLCAAEQSQGR